MKAIFIWKLSYKRQLPYIIKIIGSHGKIGTLHWKTSNISLALQPEALVNTSGRDDFSSPAVTPRKKNNGPSHVYSIKHIGRTL